MCVCEGMCSSPMCSVFVQMTPKEPSKHLRVAFYFLSFVSAVIRASQTDCLEGQRSVTSVTAWHGHVTLKLIHITKPQWWKIPIKLLFYQWQLFFIFTHTQAEICWAFFTSKIKISVRKDTGYFMSYSGANLHVTMTDGQLNTTTGFLTDVRVLMQRKSIQSFF